MVHQMKIKIVIILTLAFKIQVFIWAKHIIFGLIIRIYDFLIVNKLRAEST